MFASNCNPCQIGYLPDFPTLKALGSAPDCLEEHQANNKSKQTSNKRKSPITNGQALKKEHSTITLIQLSLQEEDVLDLVGLI